MGGSPIPSVSAASMSARVSVVVQAWFDGLARAHPHAVHLTETNVPPQYQVWCDVCGRDLATMARDE
jgi:hypothetical protein